MKLLEIIKDYNNEELRVFFDINVNKVSLNNGMKGPYNLK